MRREVVVVGDLAIPRVVAASLPAAAAFLSLDLLNHFSAVEWAQAPRHPEAEKAVEEYREEISGVEYGFDPGDGVHWPVEAEPPREQQEETVEGWKIPEGERPDQERRVSRCRVVGGGERGGGESHQVQSAGQQHNQHGAKPAEDLPNTATLQQDKIIIQ